jgi:hypothetical protein
MQCGSAHSTTASMVVPVGLRSANLVQQLPQQQPLLHMQAAFAAAPHLTIVSTSHAVQHYAVSLQEQMCCLYTAAAAAASYKTNTTHNRCTIESATSHPATMPATTATQVPPHRPFQIIHKQTPRPNPCQAHNNTPSSTSHGVTETRLAQCTLPSMNLKRQLNKKVTQ